MRRSNPYLGQIRARWPAAGILLRADSGFARESLMSWCEAHGVGYVFGLARNERLEAQLAAELERASAVRGARRAPAPVRGLRLPHAR
ncbi:MAG: transposase [Pseudomonadota bacterium]